MAVEIELRGPLTKSRFHRLAGFLKKEGKFLKKIRRKTFVFFTNDETLDLKIRTTGRDWELVVKKGFWGARKREEVILPIQARSVETAKKILVALGYEKGIVAVRETQIFKYRGIEFALIRCPKDHYFYEAEFIDNRAIKNPEAYVKKTLESLGVKIWSEKEVYDFLMFCNRKIDKPFLLKSNP